MERSIDEGKKLIGIEELDRIIERSIERREN